jgi:hypothetical protein
LPALLRTTELRSIRPRSMRLIQSRIRSISSGSTFTGTRSWTRLWTGGKIQLRKELVELQSVISRDLPRIHVADADEGG